MILASSSSSFCTLFPLPCHVNWAFVFGKILLLGRRRMKCDIEAAREMGNFTRASCRWRRCFCSSRPRRCCWPRASPAFASCDRRCKHWRRSGQIAPKNGNFEISLTAGSRVSTTMKRHLEFTTASCGVSLYLVFPIPCLPGRTPCIRKACIAST